VQAVAVGGEQVTHTVSIDVAHPGEGWRVRTPAAGLCVVARVDHRQRRSKYCAKASPW
jgi:hypothetical protein